MKNNQIISSVILNNGTEVKTLITPYLYYIATEEGMPINIGPKDSAIKIFSAYADILYCAALNYARLNGQSSKQVPFTRIDFHEYLWADADRFKNECLRIIEVLNEMKDGMVAAGQEISTRFPKTEETPAQD